jgi:hypothetical protein
MLLPYLLTTTLTAVCGSHDPLCYCSSSGNHAAAVALAAELRGIPAHIVVPRDAPACKVNAVRTYGGGTTPAVTKTLRSASGARARWACKLQFHTSYTMSHLPFQAQSSHSPSPQSVSPSCINEHANTHLACFHIGQGCGFLLAGNLFLCDPTLAAREDTAAAVADETGATFIHPYDYGPVIAGQGTVGLELLQQVRLPTAVHAIARLSPGSNIWCMLWLVFWVASYVWLSHVCSGA